MTIYYKAVRPDGKDFYSATIDYAGALGGRVKAPSPANKDGYSCCSNGVLHAADDPASTLIGGSWPCRLFEVSGKPVAQEGHKFGFRSLKVEREIENWRALGPQGQQVAAMIDYIGELTPTQLRDVRAADAAAYAAYAAANAAADAAYAAANAADAADDAANAADAAGSWCVGRTARALVVRHLIGQYGFTQAHYDMLTRAWRVSVGPLHPEDEDLR